MPLERMNRQGNSAYILLVFFFTFLPLFNEVSGVENDLFLWYEETEKCLGIIAINNQLILLLGESKTDEK